MTTTQVEPRTRSRTLPEPTSERWQLLRAGLQNVWEYDDQRFVFHRGRLLLRGRNEAGKSKALEVLLPFLLDANLSPQRLDPFGSTSRKMRWNLINDNNPEVKVSIGYVWLEFGRVAESGAEFCTIGAGLRATRTHTNVDAWYFVTSQRVDAELRTLGTGRVPLTKGRIADAIGDLGNVFDRGSEYRREVNRRLFGMPQDQYDTLVEALLQLRRPQLSKQLQPKELSRILSLSLPPLDDDVVGRLAEGFDRLDRHRAEREQRFEALRTLQKFLDVYSTYAKAVARARAQRVTEAESAYRRARTELQDAERSHEAATKAVEMLSRGIRKLECDEADLGTQIDTLKSSDAYRAAQQVDEAEKAAGEADERVDRELARVTAAKKELERSLKQLEAARGQLATHETSMAANARAAATVASAADLIEAHEAIRALVDGQNVESAKGALRSAAENRTDEIRRLEAAEHELAPLRSVSERCEERRREAEEAVRARQAEHEESERSREECEGRFCDDVRSWAESTSVPSLSMTDIERALSGALELTEATVRERAKRIRADLDEEASQLELLCSDVGRDVKELRFERDRIASQPHLLPSQPSWRTDRDARPGAPLYLLCDFVESLDPQEAARIEAALEGAGLLDAWLTPAGTLLDPDTFDVVLRPEPLDGQTLADVLLPAQSADVSREVTQRALRTIALVDDHLDGPQGDECSCWVAKDGTWRVGPLHGALRKECAEFIGASVRREARARRLAELAEALAEKERELQNAKSRLEGVQARRRELETALEHFPSVQAVIAARTHEERALIELQRVRELLDTAAAAAERAGQKVRDAEAKRDAVAAEARLTHWIGKLDELRRVTTDYQLEAQEFLHKAERHVSLTDQVSERGAFVDKTRSLLKEAEVVLEDERKAAAQARSHATALRESAGEDRTEVLARLRTIELRRKKTTARLDEMRDKKSGADKAVGKSEELVARWEAAAEERDGERAAATLELQRFATGGLLSIAEIDVKEDPTEWGARQTLLAARKIQTETGEINFDEGALEKAENRVVDRQQELLRGLPGDFHVSSHRADGVLLYTATVGTQTCGLQDVVRDLEDDISARDRLLGEEERKLFESFLSGEAHEHLGLRLRKARALVDRMNELLAARPTASGMLLRLVWRVMEEAPAGAAQAIDLVLKASQLLSDADRRALQRFLEQRLVDAREDESPGSLREKMLRVLDYRTWFDFRIEIRDDTGRWKRMTKKTHAAGSGGQKAVMLHLPLFAAAAAFYEAADDTSARIVMLDEAFAGIDREMRGQLMGLLAEFDLDFVMTSHEEWGFYEELDGLATYHLQRQPGIPGVYTDWFRWDGQQAHELRAH